MRVLLPSDDIEPGIGAVTANAPTAHIDKDINDRVFMILLYCKFKVFIDNYAPGET